MKNTVAFFLIAFANFSTACPLADAAANENSETKAAAVQSLMKVAGDENPYCSWNGGPCNSLPDCCTGICDAQLHVCIQSGSLQVSSLGH